MDEKILLNVTDLMKMVTETAVKTTLDTLKKNKAKKIDIRLRNTWLLLKNYRKLMEFRTDAVASLQEAARIFEELEQIDDDNLFIEAISKSKARTNIILAHIETMIQVYGFYCDRSGKDREQKKHIIIKKMYIDEQRQTIDQMAEYYDCSTKTIDNLRKEGVNDLGIFLFGIDAISFDR